MKKFSKIKKEKRIRRHLRVRAKIFGTNQRPRLSVFRSAKHIYTQLIDDKKGETMLSASDLELKPVLSKVEGKKARPERSRRAQKQEIAKEVGKLLAKKAKVKKITEVVFDRGGYKYHGRIKALAEGAREGGLKF
jgi:large subunit ribosomal protein L18